MNSLLARSRFTPGLALILALGGPSAWADAPSPVLSTAQTTYTYAQELQWLDAGHFIVGRWDGTLTFFRPPQANEFGPVLTDVLRTPSDQGVQMLAVRDQSTFVSSDDATANVLWWQRNEPAEAGAQPEAGQKLPAHYRYRRFTYDADVGVANSGVFMQAGGQEYFVSGHENGFVLIWRYSAQNHQLQLVRKVDIHSPNPIPSPFPLRNVRDIVVWRDGQVVTGSEDGDLVLLRVPDGTVVARRRYNETAQRGINGLALQGDRLIAVACSVGPSDKNTWSFDVGPTGFTPRGSVDLKKDLTLPQSFAFRVAMATVGGQPYAFVGTQEGLLWTVVVHPDGSLEVAGNTTSDFPIGDTVEYEPTTSKLAVVGILVNLFDVGAPGAARLTPARRRFTPPQQGLRLGP